MSLAVEEMPPSCLLREGEASADEQLRLAGQLGKALLEENEELRREIRRLRDTIADSHQLCEELRCAHGVDLARLRSSFESESFELEEELAAVREQLRASERSRREMERRCSKKEEAMVGLEARVRSLEEEVEQSRPAAAAQSNKLRSATSLESCDVEDCCVSSWRGQQESTPEENQTASLIDAQHQQSLKVAELCRDKEQLQCSVEALEEQLTEAMDQVEKRDEEVGELTQELEEAHQALDALRQEAEQQVPFSPFSTNTSIHEELAQVADLFSGPPGDRLLGYQVEREGPCLQCSWLEQELEQVKYESTRLSNQVLELVQQKLRLSQQVDAWETDVATMVEGNITKQLQQDQKKSVRRQPAPSQTTTSNSAHKSWATLLRSAFS